MTRLTSHFLSASALALAVSLTAAPAQAQSTLEEAQSSGSIRIGFANEAPFGYQNIEGELTGEAPEVAKAVLERMGITEVEGVLTEFGSLIPGLQAGRFDMIAAGMYITPARCEQILFSEPSYAIGEAFAVAEGNPEDLHSYQDFVDNPDLQMGVMAGAVQVGYAEALGIPQDQLVVFPDGPSAVAGVRTGRVDAYAGTALTIQDLVGKNPEGVERAMPFENPVIGGEEILGYGAFGFRKEDEAFRDAFNEVLLEFRGSPEHLALVEPFGFTETEMPEKTTEELCAAGG